MLVLLCMLLYLCMLVLLCMYVDSAERRGANGDNAMA